MSPLSLTHIVDFPPSLPPPVVKERGEQVSADSLSLIFWASVQNTYTSVGAGLLPLWNF